MFCNTLKNTSVMHNFISFQQHTLNGLSYELFPCTVNWMLSYSHLHSDEMDSFFLCLKFEHRLEGSNSQGHKYVKTADFLNGQPMLIYNKLSSPTSPHFLMFYWKSILQTCFCTSRSRIFSLICALRKNPGTAHRKKDEILQSGHPYI